MNTTQACSREEVGILATDDQQDAYCVARWLSEMDERGFLSQYFQPSLTDEERKVTELEGWIFWIM